MGPLVIIAAVVGLAALGFLGWFVVKLINDGPQEKAVDIDSTKVKEWETAIKAHNPEKAADEAFESSSEAYAEMKSLAARAGAGAGPPVRAVHVCQSLDEYQSFSVSEWAAENLDADEAGLYLEQLDRLAKVYSGIRDSLDRACVMACDEQDEKARAACWKLADGILDLFPDGLRVAYSYTDPPANKRYRNTAVIERAKLRRLAGRGSDPRDGMDGGLSPKDRHESLKAAGYRCAQCGRSPLSGAMLRIWTDGGAPQCLCERCRLR